MSALEARSPDDYPRTMPEAKLSESELAAMCRRLACAVNDEATTAALVKLAEQYEIQADQAAEPNMPINPAS
jgi:hypothetical protein